LARKILLADDSVTAQNMGRKILADAGYEVITVNNGSAALKKIAEAKPDLIVLDVYMPGYSGLEVCQRLKEAQETARTPVLLTVGKLEPFKPEEAKRVRAEGFIVKPFEASELLSALSKLEDKIVPRAEPSKPGRFARAIAAVEESGRSGRGGTSDEDSGWKNRIAFPSKKKQKQEEDGDEPAIYNAMNRDLRTVVEHGAAHKGKDEPTSVEDRVDVAALGAPGVRDVSAEEIAAIAAAAAQVQASSAAVQESAEIQRSNPGESTAEGQAGAASEHGTEQQSIENKPGVQVGGPAETVSDESLPAAVSVEGSPAATLAETTSAKDEARRERDDGEIRRDDRSEIAIVRPANAEMIAAIASLEPSNGSSWNAGSSAFGSGHPTEEMPVTMAVGSAAVAEAGTRWMAIPVAIDPDEAAISLELEMQKAYAAFAAAEANSPGFVSSVPDGVAPALDAASSAASMVVDPEVAPGSESELAQSMNAVASASAEALGGAVTELAAVAASHADAPSEVLAQNEHGAAPSGQEAPSVSPISERAEDLPGQNIAPSPIQANETGPSAEFAIQPGADNATEEPVVQAAPEAAPIVGEATAVHDDPVVAGMGNMAEKIESELAESTAAAWASWRQVRETAQPQPAHGPNFSEREFGRDEASSLAESSAMAVAAGAEKAPEEASASDSDDPAAIASIVDSVLADLRPKIVEEISRKLGKKK
jgi:two-component system chemotaxis response regulator CheY